MRGTFVYEPPPPYPPTPLAKPPMKILLQKKKKEKKEKENATNTFTPIHIFKFLLLNMPIKTTVRF
jgi:hypothetical protein